MPDAEAAITYLCTRSGVPERVQVEGRCVVRRIGEGRA